MSEKQRKSFTAQFKAMVSLEAIRGEKTLTRSAGNPMITQSGWAMEAGGTRERYRYRSVRSQTGEEASHYAYRSRKAVRRIRSAQSSAGLAEKKVDPYLLKRLKAG